MVYHCHTLYGKKRKKNNPICQGTGTIAVPPVLENQKGPKQNNKYSSFEEKVVATAPFVRYVFSSRYKDGPSFYYVDFFSGGGPIFYDGSKNHLKVRMMGPVQMSS